MSRKAARKSEVVVDLTEHIAAKTALQKRGGGDCRAHVAEAAQVTGRSRLRDSVSGRKVHDDCSKSATEGLAAVTFGFSASRHSGFMCGTGHGAGNRPHDALVEYTGYDVIL